MQVAIFGAGCFWCSEAVFSRLKGVQSVLPGFAGGHVDNPSYQAVCQQDTGHIEVVRIEYDENQVDYATLLSVFFAVHDPTSVDKQGEDEGPQYASAIFVTQPDTQAQIADAIAQAEQAWGAPIVTKVLPEATFWPAEDYHRNYFAHHPTQPYCALVVASKVAKFEKAFAHLLR